jgi:hypothetical protein
MKGNTTENLKIERVHKISRINLWWTEMFVDLIWTEPLGKGCSRIPKRLKKFPINDVVKSLWCRLRIAGSFLR